MRQFEFRSKPIIFPLIAFLVALGLWIVAQTALVAQAAPPAQEGTQTATPTAHPTTVVTTTATVEPTSVPTTTPTLEPTTVPTTTPTVEPTTTSTVQPTTVPSTTPTVEPTATPTVDPNLDFTVEVTGPAEVTVGQTFEINVVARNIPEPGIFGYQFKLNWDEAVLAPVSGTLVLSPEFPVVAKSDISPSVLEVGVSRQGAVADLTGPLTLLTLQFQANTVTDPEATLLALSDWKFGRKGGLNVPVDLVIDLEVVVIEDDVTPGEGDIVGNVTVEGRAADNQADHSVTASGDLGGVLTETTEANGDFWFDNALADTYALTAERLGFLDATCAGVVHSAEALTELVPVELLAGDIDDSQVIDITDAVAIGTVFGSTTAGEVADLNIDGEVDILDLILMAANFGQTSDGNLWVCQ